MASWDSKAAAKAVCSRARVLSGKQDTRVNECTERVANSVQEMGENDAAVSSISEVWMIVAVHSKEDREEGVLVREETSNMSQDAQVSFNTLVKNSFEPLHGWCPVQAVEVKTQEGAIEFNVADVRKSSASAVKMVRAGNRIVFDEDGSCVESKSTGERIKLM